MTVGDDDWFAVVQLSGTQYKIGKVRPLRGRDA